MSVRNQREGTGLSDRVTEEEKENEVSHNVVKSIRLSMVWFVGVLLKPLLKTRDRRCKEGRQINCQISNSGVEGAFG